MSASLVYTTFTCGAAFLLHRHDTQGELHEACRLVFCNLNRNASNALQKGTVVGEARRQVSREVLTQELIRLCNQRREKMLQKLRLQHNAIDRRHLQASAPVTTPTFDTVQPLHSTPSSISSTGQSSGAIPSTVTHSQGFSARKRQTNIDSRADASSSTKRLRITPATIDAHLPRTRRSRATIALTCSLGHAPIRQHIVPCQSTLLAPIMLRTEQDGMRIAKLCLS